MVHFRNTRFGSSHWSFLNYFDYIDSGWTPNPSRSSLVGTAKKQDYLSPHLEDEKHFESQALVVPIGNSGMRKRKLTSNLFLIALPQDTLPSGFIQCWHKRNHPLSDNQLTKQMVSEVYSTVASGTQQKGICKLPLMATCVSLNPVKNAVWAKTQ